VNPYGRVRPDLYQSRANFAAGFQPGLSSPVGWRPPGPSGLQPSRAAGQARSRGGYAAAASAYERAAKLSTSAADITERLIRLAQVFVGHFRSGLAHVVSLSSMLFAGISGRRIIHLAFIPFLQEFLRVLPNGQW